MTQINRIALTPTFFRISKEGIDALNPPNTTPEYLLFNSDWGSTEKRHSILFAKNTDLLNPRTILFTQLSEPPFAVMIPRSVGGTKLHDIDSHTDERWFSGERTSPAYVSDPKLDYKSDNHIIRNTTRNSVTIQKQEQKTAFQKFNSVTGNWEGNFHGTNLTYNNTKYDFLIMIFKRGTD